MLHCSFSCIGGSQRDGNTLNWKLKYKKLLISFLQHYQFLLSCFISSKLWSKLTALWEKGHWSLSFNQWKAFTTLCVQRVRLPPINAISPSFPNDYTGSEFWELASLSITRGRVGKLASVQCWLEFRAHTQRTGSSCSERTFAKGHLVLWLHSCLVKEALQRTTETLVSLWMDYCNMLYIALENNSEVQLQDSVNANLQ